MNGNQMPEHAWLDDAAAYALDALDPDRQREFEAHLAGCARCRAEVDELREVTGAIALAAPPAAPPAALRERVLARARQERPLATAPSLRAGRAPRLAWLATAASVALALLAGWGYQAEREQRAALEREFDRARLALAERDSLLGALLAPDVRTIQLAGERAPSVRLYWNRQRGMVVLTAADLPPAPSGRTYQLWGIAPGRDPVSLGTFDTSRGGEGRLVATVPAGLELAVSAVTEEPAGGSPQPTSTPFLVGEWAE